MHRRSERGKTMKIIMTKVTGGQNGQDRRLMMAKQVTMKVAIATVAAKQATVTKEATANQYPKPSDAEYNNIFFVLPCVSPSAKHHHLCCFLCAKDAVEHLS